MKIKEFLRKVKWFEFVYLTIAFIAILISFFISPEQNYLSLICSLMGIFTVFCVAKGFFLAPVFCIIEAILYLILSIGQNYYGEIIICAITILMSIFTFLTWLKNRNKKDKSFVQVNKIKRLEYILILPACAVIGVGCYFMLQAFGTNELFTSTISMVTSIVATYLILRRSSYYALAYIVNDVIVVVLWCLTIKNVGLEFLPTIISYALYFVNDVYGLVNWKLMEKRQSKQAENTEEKAPNTGAM